MSRFRLAVGSEEAFKLTFAMLLIVAALGFTYSGSDGDFPPRELYRVLLHMLAVSGVLLVGALVLPRSRAVSNAALALATLAGLFTAYVVHTELFHPANRVWMVLGLAASLFALFTACRAIDNLRYGGIVLTAAAALTVAAAGWSEVGPKLQAGMKEPSIIPEAVMAKYMAIGTTDFHRLMHSGGFETCSPMRFPPRTR